ncbi:hypothetical protein R1sor_010159 [Riccia sorocarpa]|uniref:Uncharacterized protein n=1 Tax=Riccia sorocarpa TaxID=122646 RepID=A0ABD3HXG4_9MARC
MSAAAETAWKDQVEKLIRWQNKVNKGDHMWRVKIWDEGYNTLAKTNYHITTFGLALVLVQERRIYYETFNVSLRRVTPP